MSLKKRIGRMASDVAQDVVRGLLAESYSSLSSSNNTPLVSVSKVDGNNITVTLPDGSTQTVIAATSRPIGTESFGIVINGVLL